MTAIWAEEAKDEGVRFLSVDPGDMDTPLHALAVPDADPATLKRPDCVAQEVVALMLGALRENASLALTPRA
jgi:NAD(P)-dependent dehydrogenase (short-subunit alcohol dehydrogenase family)